MSHDTKAGLPTWDLSDLYDGMEDPKLDADLANMVERAETFERKYKGRIAHEELTADFLATALQEYETLLETQYKPMYYARLLFSTDTTDARRGALLQRTREISSETATHLLFFDLEIGQISPEIFDRLIENPKLSNYRHYLEHERALAKHRLSEAEERVLEETANIRGRAFGRLFTEVTSRQTFHVREEKLTQSELMALFYDPNRETRRLAAEALTATLRDNTHVLTFTFNTLLHEKQIMDRLRRFPTPESSRHLDNEVDASVVETVVDVCVRNHDIVADYYDLKRQLLGLDELTHYDRYAPLDEATKTIPFDEAERLILDAFGGFSSKLAETTARFFDQRRIDAVLHAGKEGGAYCMGIAPSISPYIFMNYTAKLRDVMTLAHELGHAVHYQLSGEQTFLNYHSVLPMQETASTFGEMLVFDKLQNTLSSDRDRLALLCGKLEDTFATVFRQIAMYRFELQAHRLRREKGEQPMEVYGKLWQSAMQAMFGDALTLGDEHRWWWLYIPHVFQMPFYVYAYAFGELLVFSLYAQYQQEGEAFVPKYFELLSSGGMIPPAELVANIGFDIASPDFWEGGCRLIRQQVENAKSLV